MKISIKKKKVSTLDDKTRLEIVVLWVYISLYEHCEESCVSQLLKRLWMSVKKADISSRICHVYTHVLEVWCLQLLNKHLKMVSNYTAVDKKERKLKTVHPFQHLRHMI